MSFTLTTNTVNRFVAVNMFKKNCLKLRLWNAFKGSKVEKRVKMFLSISLIFYLFVSLFVCKPISTNNMRSYFMSLNSLSTILGVNFLCCFSLLSIHLSISVSFLSSHSFALLLLNESISLFFCNDWQHPCCFRLDENKWW